VRRIRLIALLLLLATRTVLGRAAEIRVWAAASLLDALNAVAVDYEKTSGDHIIFNFAGSSVLARQIIEGAPADIFFSADQAWMDTMEKAGLIDPSTRRSPIGNSLVIVVSRTDGAVVNSSADLASPNVGKLALADPEVVPAGRYASQWLKKLGLWDKVRPKVVPTGDVRGALAAVESGNVDAAIVYKTDAQISNRIRVAFEVPRAEGPDIRYAVAQLREAPHPAAARKLLDYLCGPEGARVFGRFGFLVLPAAGAGPR